MNDDQFREGLLNELRSMLRSGEITREALLKAVDIECGSATAEFSQQSVATTPTGNGGKSGVFIKVLYFAGACIALAGIVFLIAQVWDDIGAISRVVITLGLGILLTILGVNFHRDSSKVGIAYVFEILGGLLIPGGALVTLFELVDADMIVIESTWPFVITYGMVALFYGLLRLGTQSSVLTFFAIASGTAFLYFFAIAVLPRDALINQPTIIENLTTTIGIGYLLLAYALTEKEHPRLIGILNFFGVLGILFVGFLKLLDYSVWELFFLPLVIASLAYAVFMKSTGSLVVGSLFLMAYFIYITAEHFADSI